MTKSITRADRLTARMKAILDLMVWGSEDGKPLSWQDAAKTGQISTRSMRRVLERPVVRRYIAEQKQVLLACLSAKNLSHLDELASQRSNMGAAVAAARVIEGLDDARPAGFGDPRQQPGLTINILPAPASPQPVITVNPSPRQIEAEPPFKWPPR